MHKVVKILVNTLYKCLNLKSLTILHVNLLDTDGQKSYEF